MAPQGKWKLKQFLNVLMDEQGGASLSPRMILLIEDARAQWADLDRRIAAFDAEFVRWAKENEEDPSQCRGRHLGQQAGEDRLGGAAAQETV